ncbi:hypothetical protein DFH09DRAFT_1336718 [Mycena vulgaris]|nr:hypothetical protein DFH09DRAFT_1336718 [Mycena vulgaris]
MLSNPLQNIRHTPFVMLILNEETPGDSLRPTTYRLDHYFLAPAMHSPQVGPSDLHRLVNRWPPQHHGLGSASANWGRLHLSDGTHASHQHRAASDRSQDHFPCYYLPSPSPHRGNWRPAVDKVFSPAARPYQHLSAELEPPWKHTDVARVPHEHPASVDTMYDADDEDFIDISALADQYLDLSEHWGARSARRSRASSAANARSRAADRPRRPGTRRTSEPVLSVAVSAD